MKAPLFVSGLALALLGGCATVDVYDFQARPLPNGTAPLAALSDSLRDLRDVSWSWGEPDPDPSRRAQVSPTPTGLEGHARVAESLGAPFDLSYAEIAGGVRLVTQLNGVWIVHIYDRHNRLVRLEFNSYTATRLFLDAASALARS